MVNLKLFGGTNPAAVSQAADAVAVLGLGRFGSSVALELMSTGCQVLAVDANAEIVQRMNTKVTHAVRADTTDEDTLRELGINEFDRVVIAIGTDIEASILTASLVLGFGHADVWAKAISDPHGRILAQLGVQHVIYPEKDMGRRVAHLVRNSLLDFVEIGTDFAVVRAIPPADLQGRPLAELPVWDQHGVSVIAVKRRGGRWEPVTPETVLVSTDTIQVVGRVASVESFAGKG